MSSTYENNNRLEEPCRQHDIAEGGIRMENTMDSERFLESPELLLNLCRDIVQKLDEKRDDSWREEKEKQFTEVSRTIERLEKSETAIPEELQSLKTGLLAELSVIVKSNVALERLLEGFDDIIKDIRKRCGGHREVKNQASQNRKQSGPPKIDNVTLRNIIVDLFKGRAGRGHIEQVLF